MIGRLGWTTLLLGIVVLGSAAFGVGPSIARFWSNLHANSLVGLQGFVDRWLDPDPGNATVWFDLVVPVLAVSVLYPAGIVLVALALGVLIAGRS